MVVKRTALRASLLGQPSFSTRWEVENKRWEVISGYEAFGRSEKDNIPKGEHSLNLLAGATGTVWTGGSGH